MDSTVTGMVRYNLYAILSNLDMLNQVHMIFIALKIFEKLSFYSFGSISFAWYLRKFYFVNDFWT